MSAVECTHQGLNMNGRTHYYAFFEGLPKPERKRKRSKAKKQLKRPNNGNIR